MSINDITPLIYALMCKFLMLGHLELMFQVNDECSSGMVSAHVRSWRGKLVYQSLVVDLPSGERVLLKGTPNSCL